MWKEKCTEARRLETEVVQLRSVRSELEKAIINQEETFMREREEAEEVQEKLSEKEAEVEALTASLKTTIT